MLTLLSPQFWIHGIFFFIATWLVWFIPGFIICTRYLTKLSTYSTMVVSYCIGMALWGIAGYLSGYANIRDGMYLLIPLYVLLVVTNRVTLGQFLKDFMAQMRAEAILLKVFVVIGVSIWMLQIAGSGLLHSDGVHFYRVQAYDGVFHIGLIERIKLHFPPMEPSAANLEVANYHYWSDMMMADISRVFSIPSLPIFFQYIPLLLSVLTLFSLIAIARTLSKGKTLPYLFIVFFTVVSDLGYLFYFYVHEHFSFSYPVIDSAATQMLNMPHVFAKLFFITIVLLLLLWKKKPTIGVTVVISVLTGVIFGLKVYFGMFVALMLISIVIWHLVLSMYERMKNRKSSPLSLRYSLLMLVLAGIVSLIVFLPPNKGAGGLSIYPLEWPRIMLLDDALDWDNLLVKQALARYYNNPLKIIWFDMFIVVVFLFASQGVRILGMFTVPAAAKKFGSSIVFALLVPTLIFHILGLFTLQNSGTGAFNVYNFFAVATIPLSIFLTIGLANLLENASGRFLGVVVTLLLIGVSLPRTAHELMAILLRHRDNTDVVTVSNKALDAYSYIRSITNPSAIFVSYPEHILDEKSTYFSAFTGRQSFLSGAYVLETHNQPVVDVKKAQTDLFLSSSANELIQKAKNLDISYVYGYKDSKNRAFMQLLESITPIYDNGEVVVYDIKKL